MFLALKELMHSKLRFSMIGLIIVLIAWLVFILSGLGNGLSTLAAATLKNMDADYLVYEQGSSFSFNKSLLSESMKKDLEDFDNVKAVTTFSQLSGAVLPEGGKETDAKKDISLLGIEAGSFIEPAIIEGKALNPSDEYGVIANETLKDEGYKLGDKMYLDGSEAVLTIVGFVENETFNHLPSVFMNMDGFRAIKYAAPGSDNGVGDAVNAFVLQGENIVAEDIDKSFDRVETATKKEAVSGMPGYKEESGTIMMMLGFLVVISAFVIAVFFYVLTIQKTQQFGVMKAIGASNGFIAKAIVSQVFVLSLVAILVGVGLTYLTAMVFPEGMPFKLDPTMVATYSVVLLFISILSSLFSVRRITKIDPLTALGRVE